MVDRCPACGLSDGRGAALVAPDHHYGISTKERVLVCPRCGSGVTEGRRGADDLSRFYPREYQGYEELPSALARRVSTAIRKVQAIYAWRSGVLADVRRLPVGRLLDVGCGRGDLVLTAATHGWRAEGLEPSEIAASRARAKGLTVQRGDLPSAELPDGAYDVVLFHHSLEHTDDPERDLRVAHRALRHGGRLIVVVPNFGGWQARLFRGFWYHLDVPRHRTHFSRAGLIDLLVRTGFDVEVARLRSSAVGLPASVQYRLFKRCLFPSGLPLRVAAGLCSLLAPGITLVDRLVGDGDAIYIRATRR